MWATSVSWRIVIADTYSVGNNCGKNTKGEDAKSPTT